ncbi:hypothetical protein BREVNS_1309 [Brevinematales bacterium NS]|jgi:hypothetical protein|nr:hypothetical protein BREVNS_1309 [Brevinematales bacterium NS]
MAKEQNTNLKVNFTDSASNVSYSNFALINNSSEEFLFDFGNITPGREGIEIFSRIALSPRNAKLFFLALGERVREYERAFGEIEVER